MRQFIQSIRSITIPFAMVAAVLAGACLTSAAAAQSSRAIRITDATVTNEANGGSGNLRFTVRRDSGGQSGSVQYATANVTATGGSNSCNGNVDYLSRTDALGFSSADTVKFIDITVCGDNLDEATETFTINLSSSGLQIGDATAVATIVDDDPTPRLSIGNATVTEGNGGQTATATLTVTLSAVSGQQVSVAVATNNGSALSGACGSGGDYVALNSSLTFLPGAATSQQVSVTVCGDVAAEGNETFQVRLTGAQNATIQTGTGTATITDDEATSLTINDVTATEGTAAVFTVTLNGAPTAQAVTVQYATRSGTARQHGGSAFTSCFVSVGTKPDYLFRNGTLTFQPGGARTQTIAVGTCVDAAEPPETFMMDLSGVSANAQIARATGTGTIR